MAQHEFGLDVIALVGRLRHREHRSVPEIHARLRERGVEIAERSVTNLMDRYDELLAVSLTGTAGGLAPLLREVAEAVGVPVEGVVSDGQTSIRRAVERALPGVAHQLCQFHFLREAAWPVFEADRHAKVLRLGPDPQGAAGEGGRQPGAGRGQGGQIAPRLARLRQLIARGLERTAALWPTSSVPTPGSTGPRTSSTTTTRRPPALSGAALTGCSRLCTAAATRQALAGAVGQFRKVARRCRAGLFHCCAVPGLPRTNNDLEQLFGAQRCHERRASGRKPASSSEPLSPGSR